MPGDEVNCCGCEHNYEGRALLACFGVAVGDRERKGSDIDIIT